MSFKTVNEPFKSDKKYNELINNILSTFKELPKNNTVFLMLKKDTDKYTLDTKYVSKDFLKDIGKCNKKILNYIPFYDEEIFEEFFVEEVKTLNNFINGQKILRIFYNLINIYFSFSYYNL